MGTRSSFDSFQKFRSMVLEEEIQMNYENISFPLREDESTQLETFEIKNT